MEDSTGKAVVNLLQLCKVKDHDDIDECPSEVTLEVVQGLLDVLLVVGYCVSFLQ